MDQDFSNRCEKAVQSGQESVDDKIYRKNDGSSNIFASDAFLVTSQSRDNADSPFKRLNSFRRTLSENLLEVHSYCPPPEQELSSSKYTQTDSAKKSSKSALPAEQSSGLKDVPKSLEELKKKVEETLYPIPQPHSKKSFGNKIKTSDNRLKDKSNAKKERKNTLIKYSSGKDPRFVAQGSKSKDWNSIDVPKSIESLERFLIQTFESKSNETNDKENWDAVRSKDWHAKPRAEHETSTSAKKIAPTAETEQASQQPPTPSDKAKSFETLKENLRQILGSIEPLDDSKKTAVDILKKITRD